MEQALFAIIGVLLGVAITSGYTYWTVRRAELARGMAAARTLDDEMQWLNYELSRGGNFDAQPAVDVWRDERHALVLFVDSETFRFFGAAIWLVERCASETRGGQLENETARHETDRAEAQQALALARRLLNDLTDHLRAHHDTFILKEYLRELRGKGVKINYSDRLPNRRHPPPQAGGPRQTAPRPQLR